MTTHRTPKPHTKAKPHRKSKPALRHRAKALFPRSQVVLYLIVGGFNTVIGLGTSIAALWLLNHLCPANFHGFALTQPRLTVAASVVVTPLNITVSYLTYKFFVFRTRGNFVREWLKAFGVYGVSSLIGWLGLGLLTGLLQFLLHGRTPFGIGSAGYIAMAAMTVVGRVITYVGHKKFTFGGSPGAAEDAAASEAILGPEASAKLESILQEPPAS